MGGRPLARRSASELSVSVRLDRSTSCEVLKIWLMLRGGLGAGEGGRGGSIETGSLRGPDLDVLLKRGLKEDSEEKTG